MGELKKTLKFVKWDSILIAILTVAIGILCIVMPDQSANILCTIFGCMLIAVGLVIFINAAAKGGLFSGYVMMISVTMVLAGIFFLVKPGTVLALINVFFGIYIVVDSTQGFVDSILLCRQKVKNWWIIMIASLVTAALGIAVMFSSFDTVIIFAGIALIVEGLRRLIITITFSRKINRAKKEITEGTAK